MPRLQDLNRRFLAGTLLLTGLALFSSGCARSTTARLGLPPPATVEELSLSEYAGVWYDIASFPLSFQKTCTGTTATYELKDNGKVRVKNQCFRKSLDGKRSGITGSAWRPDEAEPGKLKVRFFWPLKSDYWVIDLAEDYSYAVVGSPDRDALWILSRTPQMAPEVYAGILERITEQGFEVERLRRVPQATEGKQEK